MKSTIASLLLSLLTMSCYGQLATPDHTGLRYGHVHLNVTDVDAHIEIWTRHFGGELIRKDQITAIKFANMFVFLNQQTPSTGSRETTMDHFGFKVRDIDEFLHSWRQSNLEVGTIFTGAEGQSNVYVTLPDGVYVELQEDQGLSQEVSGYHVHFYSPEPQRLLDWYSQIFETDIKPRGSITTTTNVPGHNLSFARTAQPRKPTKGSSIDHIGFDVDNLEDFVKTLKAKGIDFDQVPRPLTKSKLKSAFFTDPAGTLIELTEGLGDY